jgi:hypothetical protein
VSKKYTLKPITENSWILSDSDGERIGIVSKNDSGVIVVGKLPVKKYNSINELKATLGGKLTIETKQEKDDVVVGDIDGYPIKHPAYSDQLIDPVPNYLKGKIRFAAGYYAIKSANGWTPTLCPKLLTIANNEYLGPFKSKIEMNHQISTKKKEIQL